MPISNADAIKIAKEVIKLLKTDQLTTPSALVSAHGKTASRDDLLRATAQRAEQALDIVKEIQKSLEAPEEPEEPTPNPDPDPEPETPVDPPTGLPDAKTVGFLGDVSKLERIRGYKVPSGTVIENKYIDTVDGALIVDVPNVVVRNCVFNVGIWGVDALDGATNLIVEDCTFIGGHQAAIGLSQAKNWTIRRNNFHSGRDAIKPGGSGVIENNYMHDPATGGDAHNDCIQFSDADGIIIRNNRMEGADTSCIAMFEGQATAYKNVTIENNHMTGAGYIVYAGGRTGTNIKIKNNVFGNWGWGPVTDWVNKTGNEWSGNVDLTGKTVTP